MPPSGGSVDYHTFVSRILEDRLDSHPGWPANIFQLECESYGIYQNATGNVLKELLERDEIGKATVKIQRDDRPFITRPTAESSDIEQDIIDATRDFDTFLTTSGFFAELSVYVALCKVHEELSDRIEVDVLPKGPRPHLLNYPGRDPDALIMLPSEYVPVEVYNGKNYLGTNGRKFQQSLDLSSFDSIEDDDGSTELGEADALNSYPFLINRRSDDSIKNTIRRMNGMVVDTDCIIGCEDTHLNIEDILELLKVKPLVEMLPSLETNDGVSLNGNEYDQRASEKGKDGILRPPSIMADAAADLPLQFMQRIRGGVQLQYVNSLYRQFSEPAKRTACLVLQTIYNQLLREGGWDRDFALQEGWDKTTRRYPRIKSAGQRKESILEETRTLISRLRDEKIIVEQNNGLHARKAWHPQQSLSFRS